LAGCTTIRAIPHCRKRYALVARYPALRSDPGFRARIVELLYTLKPDDRELAAIFNEARLLNNELDCEDGPES
jgi:hypothetical protein